MRRELVYVVSDELNTYLRGTESSFQRYKICATRWHTHIFIWMITEGMRKLIYLVDLPYLEPDDIRASLEYAAAQIDHAVVMVRSEFPGRCSTGGESGSSGCYPRLAMDVL